MRTKKKKDAPPFEKTRLYRNPIPPKWLWIYILTKLFFFPLTPFRQHIALFSLDEKKEKKYEEGKMHGPSTRCAVFRWAFQAASMDIVLLLSKQWLPSSQSTVLWRHEHDQRLHSKKSLLRALKFFFGRCQLSFLKKGFPLFQANDSMAHSVRK